MDAVKDLSQVVGTMAIDITNMKSDITDMKIDITGMKSDIKTLKSDVSTLKKQMVEVQDEQERQGKKLDQITSSNSFTPFTSGALVA